MVYPKAYRDKKEMETFLCPACSNSSILTIVTTETAPRDLMKENGMRWLGFEQNDDLFNNRSAFKLITTHGKSVFKPRPIEKHLHLTLQHKKVHNALEVLDQVEEWVGSGKVELGSCSLCFDDRVRGSLLPACGRKGCKNQADTECLREWVRHSAYSIGHNPINYAFSTARPNQVNYSTSCNSPVPSVDASPTTRPSRGTTHRPWLWGVSRRPSQTGGGSTPGASLVDSQSVFSSAFV
jgi:hypothetical protein